MGLLYLYFCKNPPDYGIPHTGSHWPILYFSLNGFWQYHTKTFIVGGREGKYTRFLIQLFANLRIVSFKLGVRGESKVSMGWL